jgi:hypothetical protein
MMTEGQQQALQREVSGVLSSIGATHGKGAWKNKLMVKDSIADITLQQVWCMRTCLGRIKACRFLPVPRTLTSLPR